MLHKTISEYLELVDELVLRFPDFYVDHYVHEVISRERVNVRFRIRTRQRDAVSVWSVAVVTLTPALSLKGEGVC